MDIAKQKDSNSLIFKMSIPIFIELLLQMLVGNVDQIMVSHFSQDGVGAIGNANQILNIVIIVLSVMSIATTVLISRYLGAKDERRIAEVVNTSLFLMTVICIVITAALFIFCNPILTWMKVPETIFGETASYMLVVGTLVVLQGLYMTFAAVLRSYTLMKEVMYVAVIMNILNIIGNAILINGLLGFPQFGILGSAISTNFSRILGLGMMFWLFKKKVNSELSFQYLQPFPWQTTKNILHISVPSGAEQLSYHISQIFIMKFTNLFGTMVITTKVFCSMFANVAFIYSMALSQATQIFVSYLIGGNFLKKVNAKVWITVAISIGISVGISTLLYLNSDFVFGIFTKNPEILKLGKQILFVEIFLEIGRAINIVMTRCLIAVEDPKFPAVICVISAWTIGVGGGYLLGVHFGLGLVGIWIAMTCDEILRGILFIFRFRYGKWWNRVHHKKQEEMFSSCNS